MPRWLFRRPSPHQSFDHDLPCSETGVNAMDFVGGNHGSLKNGTGLAPRRVGTAFSLANLML
jgi:hypothetical protein